MPSRPRCRGGILGVELCDSSEETRDPAGGVGHHLHAAQRWHLWVLCEDPSRCDGLAWGNVEICFFVAHCGDAEHDFLGLLKLNPEYSRLSRCEHRQRDRCSGF